LEQKFLGGRMKRRTGEIRKAILEEVDEVGAVSAAHIAKAYGISRQAVFKNIRELVAAEVLIKTLDADYPYRIKPIKESNLTVHVGPETQENKIWTESVAPLLEDLNSNVREISHYGFTEMFNNVIDHSMSKTADIRVKVDPLVVRMAIQDHGIGIWRKLQEAFHLDDPRHALLELTKGKLTTDPRRHTGEGIFFTSRMFNKFHLDSDKLTFCRFQEGDEWLFDVKEDGSGPGTRVSMAVYVDSEQTPKAVFDKFTTELDNFGFSKTNLPVELAKYEGDHLVSRSQAKRLLTRLDKFKEVYLDFKNVTEIGQAFADEIFRVFKNEHQDIRIVAINQTPEVEMMIQRALKHDAQAPLSSELPS
jgi:anti-sigma regulatory factor (Ser/Thr protein kinase)/biotin operon repressor